MYLVSTIYMKKITSILIIALLITPSVTFAHPGRTDSAGGHTCRTNCASWGLSNGEYHYHRSKGVPQVKEPVKSIQNKNGAGKTVPAPEYKTPASNINTPTPKAPNPPTKTEKLSPAKRFFNWVF